MSFAEGRIAGLEQAAKLLDDYAAGYEARVRAFGGGENDTTFILSALARELRDKANELREMAKRFP